VNETKERPKNIISWPARGDVPSCRQQRIQPPRRPLPSERVLPGGTTPTAPVARVSAIVIPSCPRATRKLHNATVSCNDFSCKVLRQDFGFWSQNATRVSTISAVRYDHSQADSIPLEFPRRWPSDQRDGGDASGRPTRAVLPPGYTFTPLRPAHCSPSALSSSSVRARRAPGNRALN
jgi:hypothetical protein